MARNNEFRGLSSTEADLAVRCVPIAKLLYQRIEPKDPFVTQVSISSFCFAEREIYQTLAVSVALSPSQSSLETKKYVFVLFNRKVLAHDYLMSSEAVDQWEIQRVDFHSRTGGCSSSSWVDRVRCPALFESTPALPLPAFPDTPIVGKVDILKGSFSDGFGLQVKYDPAKAKPREGQTTIVRSFEFSNFYQYCVAQSLAVGFRELCCAQAKFDKAWKEFDGKLPQPTTAE